MTADTVYTIAKTLPLKELKRLYTLIGELLGRIEEKPKPSKVTEKEKLFEKYYNELITSGRFFKHKTQTL